MGPVALVGLLQRHDPMTAWAAVLAGAERRPVPKSAPAPSGTRVQWEAAARRIDVAGQWSALTARGMRVAYHNGPGYPASLADDHDPPAVLFWRGDLAVLDRRRVAIVGTRRCTHYGREVAFELGRDLACQGVCVLSGLALGIDGAAHLGALEPGATAAPVGVAASGVDVIYPRRHADLWSRVVAAGAILSETAPGQPAQAWRFPARNRIIAGLAAAVVVVESHLTGGSMLTVDAALARNVEVMAVPGPVHSPASAGTNQLLVEGSRPVRHAADVLDALGDVRPWPAAPQPALLPAANVGRPPRAALDAAAGPVLDAVDWTPTTPGVIAERTGLAVAPLARALRRLEQRGLVRENLGRWERIRAR
jgi:DNA processing protein